VKLWNIEGHTGAVNSVAFGPDGRTIATGSSDRTARLWNVSGIQPRLQHTLGGHRDQVYRVALDPSGTRLATAGFDNRVKLWDVESGDEIPGFPKHKHVDQLRDVTFSADGRFLASTGADGAAWLYPLESGDIGGAAVPVNHNEADKTVQASAVAFRPESAQWATAGYDGRLRLWSLSGASLGTITAPSDKGGKPRSLFRMAFSPDGSTIAALAGHRVYLWPVTAFEQAQSEPTVTLTVEETGFCRALAYSRDGSQIAVGCNDGGVRVFDTATRRLIKTITVHQNAVGDLAFSPDGTELATASFDKTFHVSPLRFEALYEVAKRLRAATSGDEP
jgi:WD40 repeat protein